MCTLFLLRNISPHKDDHSCISCGGCVCVNLNTIGCVDCVISIGCVDCVNHNSITCGDCGCEKLPEQLAIDSINPLVLFISVMSVCDKIWSD